MTRTLTAAAIMLAAITAADTPATAGDHAIFICPPGKTKVWILYDDDSKVRAREADKKGELKKSTSRAMWWKAGAGKKTKSFHLRPACSAWIKPAKKEISCTTRADAASKPTSEPTRPQ